MSQYVLTLKMPSVLAQIIEVFSCELLAEEPVTLHTSHHMFFSHFPACTLSRCHMSSQFILFSMQEIGLLWSM